VLRAVLREKPVLEGAAWGPGPSYCLLGDSRSVRYNANQRMWMTETQAHPPVPGAFACSIPASRPLSVLEHDKAYISSDACTVHRAPFNDQEGLAKKAPPWPGGLNFPGLYYQLSPPPAPVGGRHVDVRSIISGLSSNITPWLGSVGCPFRNLHLASRANYHQ